MLICGWCCTSWLGLALGQDESLSPPRFPLARASDAWRLLPRQNPPLPEWARLLVQTLPKTTGAMLELDYLHRAQNPLGAVLAGKLRWVAADALGCEYGRQYAEVDLRGVGLRDEDMQQLRANFTAATPADKTILSLARKLTTEAYAVSDADMQALQTVLNPEQVVAMVHTIAYANFQNRIFLGLGVEVGEAGPIAAQPYGLDRQLRGEVETPPRPSWDALKTTVAAGAPVRSAEWSEQTFAEIETALANQRARSPRIPMPGPERLAVLPPEILEQSSKIVWSKLSLGYQPRLTMAWFDCMRTFQSEAQFDRVFSNSLFWVITRTNHCFY